MGESIAEGTLVRWIKKVGDWVDRDEPLFEISTDKVDAEIPSPTWGVLAEIRVNEGQTVPVNSVVGVLDSRGVSITRRGRPIILPWLGEGVTTADVLRVLVRPGDTLAKDQSILELETDNATLQLLSSVAGRIKEVKVRVGDRVKVGQVILRRRG
jgi:2-oxoglutarate dehydrogenase E2 component (dihydrolipoamide succinyltransferase)